jgi:putative heme-binding domain-containing protein
MAVGHEMGPNLLTVREWPRENLLAAVLDPDRTVEPRYIAYTATLADGTAMTGLLTGESAGNVTIKTLDSVDHAVPRASIKSLTSTGHSLMPAGFEAALSAQDLADLFTFLATPSAPR